MAACDPPQEHRQEHGADKIACAFAQLHGLKIGTISDLIAYRRRHDKLVERVVSTKLPTAFGEFDVVGYRSLVDEKHHVALVKGQVAGTEDVLVDSNHRFVAAAEERGVEVTTDFRPGQHEWGLWDTVIREVIDWLPIRTVGP